MEMIRTKLKDKKLWIGICALCMMLSTIGILSYFTDIENKTNTFTVGKVDIELTEPNWDEEAVKGIMPSISVPKDPTVKNIGTNDAYVFMEVEVPYAEVVVDDEEGNKCDLAETPLFTYKINDGWVQIGTEMKDEENKVIKYVYVYGTEQEATLFKVNDVSTLFNEITFANIVSGQGLENVDFNVNVTAKAIQSNDIEVGMSSTALYNLINQQTDGELLSYPIAFHLDGATLPEGSQFNYIPGKEMTLPTPTKIGYKFIGWHFNEDLSDTAFKTLNKNLSSEIKLYAEFEKLYKITYNVEGGTMPNVYPTEYCSSEGLDTLPTPTKEGYKFKGWKKLQNESVNYVNNRQTSSRAGEVNDSNFIITTNPVGYGTVCLSKRLSLTDEISNISNGFETRIEILDYSTTSANRYWIEAKPNEGYYFIGWYDENNKLISNEQKYEIHHDGFGDFSITATAKFDKYLTSIPKGSTGDITLTAEWETQ